jgi:hypothetical protein
MTTPNASRPELESRLIEQASQNPSFRQQLLADPKAALSTFLGVALPPGMRITVLEEQPGQHYLVLPAARPAVDALPLDDLELALVGGGRTRRPFPANCGIGGVNTSNPGSARSFPAVMPRSGGIASC